MKTREEQSLEQLKAEIEKLDQQIQCALYDREYKKFDQKKLQKKERMMATKLLKDNPVIYHKHKAIINALTRVFCEKEKGFLLQSFALLDRKLFSKTVTIQDLLHPTIDEESKKILAKQVRTPQKGQLSLVRYLPGTHGNQIESIIPTPLCQDGSVCSMNNPELDSLWEEILTLSKDMETSLKEKSMHSYQGTFVLGEYGFHNKYNQPSYYDHTQLSEAQYEKWKDTFYYKYPVFTANFPISSMSKNGIEKNKRLQHYLATKGNKKDGFVFALHLATCEAYVITETGIRLLLSDPTGDILTDHIEDLTPESAQKLIGQILKVRIGYQYNNDSHPVYDIINTGFFKTDTV